MRAVEVGETVFVGGEVRRHPIHDDADPATVQVVDEIHEVLRRPVTGSGREVPRDLVAPRAVERVLHDGHQLHVCKAHLRDVIAQGVRQLTIGERAVVLVGHPSPGAEMHLVNRHGGIESVCARSRLHPLVIAPLVRQVPDDGGGARGEFGVKGERIGLIDAVTRLSRDDMIFIDRPGGHSRDKAFPDAGRIAAHLEKVCRRVPNR